MCNHRLEILVDTGTQESRSYISTKLAAQLLSAIETAELGPKPKPNQSGAATTSKAESAKQAAPKSAAKVTERRIEALEASIKAGEEVKSGTCTLS